MFKCALCKKSSKRGEKMNRRVLLQREKTYPDGGKGLEAVVEVGLCAKCALWFNGLDHPTEVVHAS